MHTKVGEGSLKVPKLRTLPFEKAIIEQYEFASVIAEPLESVVSGPGLPGRASDPSHGRRESS
jgi:hypothetical protein